MAGIEESQRTENLPMAQDNRGLIIEQRQEDQSRGGHRATESSQPKEESASSSRKAAPDGRLCTDEEVRHGEHERMRD